MQFVPTAIGEGLILAYNEMRLDNLWKPQLRGQIEAGIKDVAEGRKTKEQVLTITCSKLNCQLSSLYALRENDRFEGAMNPIQVWLCRKYSEKVYDTRHRFLMRL